MVHGRFAGLLVAASLVALVGCKDKAKQSGAEQAADAQPSPTLTVAPLAAKRGAGRARLVELAQSEATPVRREAIRALGRVGDARAVAALVSLLEDDDEAVRAAAIEALALAGAEAAAPAVAATLARQRATDNRVGVAAALGRIGGPEQATTMVSLLRSADQRIAAAAAVALGVWGRRSVAMGEAPRRALVSLAGAPDAGLRYGVAYALAREYEPLAAPGVEAALLALLTDADAETRAVAATGLRLRSISATEPLLERLRTDDDWRVRVEVVRALASDTEKAKGRAALAAWVESEWGVLSGQKALLSTARVQPLVEALEALRGHADEAAVAEMFETVEALARGDGTRRAWANTPADVRGRDRVHCLAAAGLVQGGYSIGRIPACGEASGAGWPPHLRKLLAVEVAASRPGDDGARELLVGMATDDDPRVQGAAIAAMIAAEGSVLDDEVTGLLGVAAAADGPVVAGLVAAAVAERARAGNPVPAPWLAALAERARNEAGDPELRTTLVDALVAAKSDAAVELCRVAASDANRTVRDRGVRCLEELSGPVAGARDAVDETDAVDGTDAADGDNAPDKAEKPDDAPPRAPGGGAGAADPVAGAAPGFRLAPLSTVVGKAVRWTVETSRGAFVIELDPATAPYSVAALTALAREGFYNGLPWHRVVRDFVVQGGDPTGSGWGGPGWLLPAEPSLLRFDRGAVGIADAGLDTGGCQIFVMHSRAAHLEGRYTRIGRVTSGMDVVDSLLVGDTIDSIEVSADPAGPSTPAGK